ncbi:MAG TPA: ParB/RepB/Spo0J family partition protein [Vicinamibacterales bacterium]
MPPRKTPVRRKKTAAGSIGLSAAETARVDDGAIDSLAAQVEQSGGAVLGRYRDPLGGKPLLIAALPIADLEPTPYQRDPSDAHVKRLMGALEKIGLFLDPIIVIRHDDRYWTPNGNHRLQAMKQLGAKTVTVLLVRDPDIAFKILALNTEKAHNLREKSLETIRMARALAKSTDEPENAFAFEFEQPSYLTFGAARVNYTRFSKATSFDFDETLDKIIASAQKFNVDRVKQHVAKAAGAPTEDV